MIRLEIGLEIRHGGVMRVCAIEDKTTVVGGASYRSVSRNPVRFKALDRTDQNMGGTLLEFPTRIAIHGKSRVSSAISVCDN